MTEPLDIVAIMAHPDDAELLCGGTLIKSVEQGHRVGIVDLTKGETGTRGTPRIRAREAERAAETMGLAVRLNAGLPDAHLDTSTGARRVVVGLVRELKPRIVLTHWFEGRHPDHGAAARLVRDSLFLAGLKNFEAAGEPHRPQKLVHATAFREDAPRPTFLVDISDQMERKLQAIACYGSQFEGSAQAGEVFPGGDRPLLGQIRIQCAHYGSLIRTAFAEPFWTREAVAVENLASLGVSSF